ncbi:carbohydrate ABC transporter permease [Glaciibacter psychrotolerans]|uniref:Multiple sugar transport system permease protein n=1 Tax=Glaciibacter psychrotolerans TaxID=670054 RepID=A0A7Z0EH17_9MICO|nr:sugar ABC transporter permease [Leifsonia psychrotolerans]NYJ21100.1 multiple sugar transport system permease protein [Leifsonia psychrotolerans]
MATTTAAPRSTRVNPPRPNGDASHGSAGAPRSPVKRLLRNSDGPTAALYLLPAVIGFLVFYAWPLIQGIGLSFTDWNLLSDPKFIGFDNYRRMLSDPLFWNSLRVTLIYVTVNISTQIIFALAIAGLMQRLRLRVVSRSAILVPWLVPNVTVAIITLFMLDPNVGFVNDMIELIGGKTQSFYGNSDLAIFTIALVNTWRNMGYTALLFYAGMQTISPSLYEAASLDGSTGFRTFRSITLPLLRPITAMVLVVSLIGSFQIFDTVAVATSGGPGNATRVIYYYIYQKAFEQFDMGYAATMGVALFAIIFVVSLIQLRVLRASDSDLS